MGKRLFLLILIGLLEVVNAPQFLMADDGARLTGFDDTKAVKTLVASETQNDVALQVTEVAVAKTANTTVKQPETYSVAPMPANAITVDSRTIEILDVADTSVDTGDHVNKYGAKFLYGHNTPGVFGGLLGMGVGNVFTVAYGGTARNYQVVETQHFQKNSDHSLIDVNTRVEYKMSAIANGKNKYDLVLMTCADYLPNTPNRYVLFANAI